MHLIVGLIALACAVVVFLVVLRIGAAITRTAVRMANGVLGGRDVEEFDFRRGAGYDYNPIPRPKSLAGIRAPVPGVVYAVILNFGSAIVWGVVQTGVAIGLFVLLAPPGMGLDAQGTEAALTPEALRANLLASGAGFMAGLLASVVVFKLGLPTTFFRACAVVFFQYFIVALICVALGVAMVVLMELPDGGFPNAKPTNQPVWFR